MASILKVRTQMLVGHMHAMRRGGFSKEEIRSDPLMNSLLNRMFEDAWNICEQADEKRKEMEKSDI